MSALGSSLVYFTGPVELAEPSWTAGLCNSPHASCSCGRLEGSGSHFPSALSASDGCDDQSQSHELDILDWALSLSFHLRDAFSHTIAWLRFNGKRHSGPI